MNVAPISCHEHKANHFSLLPCPLCRSAVSCYNTAVISGENQSRSHYLVACTGCGYGPAQAFFTKVEATQHWNKFVKKEKLHSV